jgi:hypothetical protein
MATPARMTWPAHRGGRRMVKHAAALLRIVVILRIRVKITRA